MRKEKAKILEIALKRVECLLDLGLSVFKRDRKLANRYVKLAWKIKTRYNLDLPRYLKRKFCRKCRALRVPNETCRVRLRSSRSPRLVITCLNCGYTKRIPYKDLDQES